MQGKVLKLFITKDDKDKTREMPQKLQVDEAGVLGDKFYAKDSQRAILISSTESYKLTYSCRRFGRESSYKYQSLSFKTGRTVTNRGDNFRNNTKLYSVQRALKCKFKTSKTPKKR